ncbi:hypothetical protein [Streptomyces sp. SAJ15]|uniref:hypothetical protein n=1 Tax=Streptomyces sp. SAJ15 TaxID=2011095 RepID=UPI0016430224|nr:hypothetical protein [Streptomyces sp. SAJ15]
MSEQPSDCFTDIGTPPTEPEVEEPAAGKFVDLMSSSASSRLTCTEPQLELLG